MQTVYFILMHFINHLSISCKKYCYVLVISSLSFSVFAVTVENASCGGPSALLNLVNRPTIADSPCTMFAKKAEIELGYQYVTLFNNIGYAQNGPQAQFRLGLSELNEFTVLLPNYYGLSLPYSGWSGVSLGVKHELGHTRQWIATVETLLTPPSGGAAFGSPEVEAAFNGIVSYAPHDLFSVSFMLGVTTLVEPSILGGGRYESINPDLVLSYFPRENLSLYAEFYGQSKTLVGEGSGINCDAGFIYLVKPYMTLDLEYGQRISGFLGGFERYVGFGMAIVLN